MREGYNGSPFPLGHDKLALPMPRIHRTKGLWSGKPPCRSSQGQGSGPQITELAFGLRARVEKEHRYEVSRKCRVGHWHSCFARERLSCHRLQRRRRLLTCDGKI